MRSRYPDVARLALQLGFVRFAAEWWRAEGDLTCRLAADLAWVSLEPVEDRPLFEPSHTAMGRALLTEARVRRQGVEAVPSLLRVVLDPPPRDVAALRKAVAHATRAARALRTDLPPTPARIRASFRVANRLERLAMLRVPGHLPILAALARKDPIMEVRLEAALLQEDTEALEALSRRGVWPEVRYRALAALGIDPWTVRLAEALEEGPSATAQELRRTGSLLPTWMRGWDDATWARLGGPEWEEVLLDLLPHTPEAGERVLLRMLPHVSGMIRVTVVDHLALVGGLAAVRVLAGLIDRDPLVAAVIREAVATLRERLALEEGGLSLAGGDGRLSLADEP